MPTRAFSRQLLNRQQDAVTELPGTTGETGLSREEAINRALALEAEAEAGLMRCQEEAEAILMEARRRRREILDRTDRRIGRVHRHQLEKIETAIALLTRDEDAAWTPEPTTEALDRLIQAVDRLADNLVGRQEPS